MAEASTAHAQAEPERPRELQQPEARRFPVLWERLALVGILLLAALMDFYKLGQNGFDTYYPPAIRSMMDNWHNFFFAAYDPGGFTSIDKPPVGFWLQVLSAKIFGLNAISVLLPQALCGVLSVLLLYSLVKRHFGVVAGLLAALVLSISPISVVTNRNATIDSTLALCLLIGAWAVLRAAETGRLRWLLLTAVIVGIGFNIKMLEAYLVVPAFGLLYLLAAPTSMKKRVLHLTLALLVLLVVSFSWVLAVDLTPASQRPHVGNTQDDSELSLALGNNGLLRLLAGTGLAGTGNGNAYPAPAGSTGGPTNQPGKQPAGRSVQILTEPVGNPGPLRLFTVEPLAGQESWLLPLALLSIVVLAWQGRPRPREDRRVHALILWGMWLLTMGIFFSIAGFFHEYYLTVMTPAVAALCGIGLVVMWRDYRAEGWRGWLLPASLLLTAVEQIVILTNYPTWGRWMIPLLTIPCLLAAGVLISVRLPVRLFGKEQVARFLLPALAVGLVALALAPTLWAVIPILQGIESDIPLAGPAQGSGTSAFASIGGQVTADPALVQYLEAHQDHAHVLVVTDATNTDGLILATNKPVIPLSGFSSYPLTASEAASLVASGTVRFFLLSGGGGAPGDRLSSVTSWVQPHCATVPPSLWQSSPSSSQTGSEGVPGASLQLYDCATPRR
ncbi:glycosyl transferase [Ktedonobacteria bacterium brp13]|nr:glycosyl transferase [Ktedonobacteria bacterium brp13]